MRIIKNLGPVLILIALAFYSYYNYALVPQAIINGVIFLPVILAFLVIGLSIHFNRSPIYFYAALIIITNIILGLELAKTNIDYALLSGFTPLLLVSLTIIPDRGIFSLRAIPAYALLLCSFMFSIILIIISPEWLTHALLTNWFPARYFDWTQLPQTALFISVISFISMLILYFLKPSSQLAVGLGVLLLLITQMHFGEESRSLNIFSSASLLMCLYGVLQESWRMAYLDELTELPARRALREKFQQIGGQYAVAMLDVDHFKKFNDTYGHDTGDAVLRMIATKLSHVTGAGSCFRYGGEEFSIIFNGKNREEAIPHLEALRETIANTRFIVNRASSRRKSDKKIKAAKNKHVNITVSIGVADSSGKASNPWDILKLADKALYRAKNKGRNCVRT